MWKYMFRPKIPPEQVILNECVYSIEGGVSVSSTVLMISVTIKTTHTNERATFVHSQLHVPLVISSLAT